MNNPRENTPILLCAKDEPCKCHVCVQVACSGCNKVVFQTVDKMDIYNRNKTRAIHVCITCMAYVQKTLRKDQLVNINLDEPIDRNN